MPLPTPDSLAEPLLPLLRTEERLLRAARESLAAVFEALRRGDLATVNAVRGEQEALVTSLRETSAARTDAAAALAAGLGLAPESVTLSALAERLPGPVGAEILAARDSLSAAAAGLAELQRRNANLIGHLRSYFRGVLSALTVADAPVRYGPTGGRVTPAAGAGIKASG